MPATTEEGKQREEGSGLPDAGNDGQVELEPTAGSESDRLRAEANCCAPPPDRGAAQLELAPLVRHSAEGSRGFTGARARFARGSAPLLDDETVDNHYRFDGLMSFPKPT